MKINDVPKMVLDLIAAAEQQHQWPAPLTVQHQLPPVPPITAAMLPAPLRPYVTDIVRRMQCPQEYVAVTLICALGVIIAGSTVVRPKRHDNWIEAPNLWGAVVGSPGRMKSPAISAALRPLGHLDKQNQLQYETALQHYQLQVMQAAFQEEQLKAELKALARPPKRGSPPPARTAQQVQSDLLQLRLNAPVEPTCTRCYTNDATMEALGILMVDNPTGVLVYQDELMGLLSSFDKPGRESDRQHYLTGWNGLSSVHVDRVGRKHLYINPFCISVFGGIQPDRLARYLADSIGAIGNDGLIQRFQLLVYPDDPAAIKTVDYAPDQAAEDDMNRLFVRLANSPHTLGAKADSNGRKSFFQFDDAAQQRVYQWLDDLDRKVQSQEHPIMSEHLGKFRKLVPSLALIFHVCDIATGVLPAATLIPLRTLELALEWSDVLEQHARRVHSISTNLGIQAAVALAKKIKAGALQDGFTQRDVHHRQWAYLKDIDHVRLACNELESANWIRAIKREKVVGRAGRPASQAYEINPKI